MTARTRPDARPATLMVWTLTDELIERHDLREHQFHQLRLAGFGGVAAYVRCSRYTWCDPPARLALRHIGSLCREHGMACWLGPDPRFASRQIIGTGGGMEVLLFGNRARADRFPNCGVVNDGSFAVRCDLEPRHVHTLNEVAIEYFPRGLAGVYALHNAAGEETPDRVVDITAHARYFYNARARYVEAFGSVHSPEQEGWRVVAFFRADTNHFDFSNPEHVRRYLALLDTLRRERCAVQGIMWDEPGFTCTYGTLPFTRGTLRHYQHLTGKDLRADLWKMAFPATDGSHVRVRCAYYASIQRSLNDANRLSTRHVQRLWGADTVSGIHDTWHFESADMCDMNHGSLDLWALMKTKTGGFVDLGGIDQLRDPQSPWYAHLAAMSVICASLGKWSTQRVAYNNLWTVGDDDGEGWQTTVMDHCVDTMALFGTRWLAHAYGPVGTIGEERSFLGSPPLPGYPDHSTWPHFPLWNKRLGEHLQRAESRMPESSVLIVFPVESMYAFAGPAADAAAAGIFRLLLALIDEHFQVDVHAPSVCRDGEWVRNEFRLADAHYRAVLCPYPLVLHPDMVPLMRAGGERVALVFGMPQRLTSGRSYAMPSLAGGGDIRATLDWLRTIPAIRPVEAPVRSWATVTPLSHGTLVSLCPSRHGYSYGGRLQLHGAGVMLPESTGLMRVLFPHAGTPVTLSPQYRLERPNP